MGSFLENKKKIIAVAGIVLFAIILAVGIYYTTDMHKVNALMHEASQYQENGEYSSAIDCYKEAIKIDDEKVEAYLGQAECLVAMGEYHDAVFALKKGYEKNKDSKEIADKLYEYCAFLVDQTWSQGDIEIAGNYAILYDQITDNARLIDVVMERYAAIARRYANEEDYEYAMEIIRIWKYQFNGYNVDLLNDVLSDAYLIGAEEYSYNLNFYIDYLQDGLVETNSNEKLVNAVRDAQKRQSEIDAVHAVMDEWINAYATLEDQQGFYVYLDASEAPYFLANRCIYHYENGSVRAWGNGADAGYYRYLRSNGQNLIAYGYLYGGLLHYELNVMEPKSGTSFDDMRFYWGQYNPDGTQSWEMIDMATGQSKDMGTVEKGTNPDGMGDVLVYGYWNDAPWQDIPSGVYFYDAAEAGRFYKKYDQIRMINSLYDEKLTIDHDN